MDSMVRFMAFMQRSAWCRFSFDRGLTRMSVFGVLALLAGCQGKVTMDLATELPADPNINQVVTHVRGLEFSTGTGNTRTLEFTSSEQVDLIVLAGNNGVLRLFTGEDLPEGNYTGVRLLFDEGRAADDFIRTTAGTQFPLNVAESNVASLSFKVDKNKNSTDSFTLVLDLRQSLSFSRNARDYNLKPVVRAVETSEMGSIEGNVTASCPAGGALSRGAVYLFQGHDVTPDDIDGSGVEPFATAPIFTNSNVNGNTYFYNLRYLPAGDYTLALTCDGNEEDPTTDQDLRFRDVINVTLNDRQTLTRNLL